MYDGSSAFGWIQISHLQFFPLIFSTVLQQSVIHLNLSNIQLERIINRPSNENSSWYAESRQAARQTEKWVYGGLQVGTMWLQAEGGRHGQSPYPVS